MGHGFAESQEGKQPPTLSEADFYLIGPAVNISSYFFIKLETSVC